MKKKLLLALATLVCIFLCACGGSQSTSGNKNPETPTTQNETSENIEDGKPIEGKDYAIGEDGHIAVFKKYCAQNMTLIELTTENWKEYFQVVEETMGTVDDFGEVSYTTKTVVKPYIEGKYVYGFYNPNNPETDGAFEFKNLVTEEVSSRIDINIYDTTSGEFDKVVGSYTLDDFELTKVSATLVIVSIPDELWNKDDNSLEYVHIGKLSDPFPFTYQSGEKIPYYIAEDIIKESK